MKKLFAGLIAVFLSITTFTSAAFAEDYSYLLPPAKSSLLGTASGFSIFMENDFAAQGSDCEGKLACGGGANLGNFEWYSTGSSDYASVIVGDGPLCNFTGGNGRKFVVGTNCPDEDIKVQGEVYKADLINFGKEFQKLREISFSLANQKSIAAQVETTWCKQITFTGFNSNYNFFTIDAADLATDLCYITFDVPTSSYSVVNILNGNVNLYTQLYGVSYAGKAITSNDDATSEQILWNLPNATTFTLNGTGTFRGSILAPNADGSDSMTSGAHVAGELIAKSYNGGIEWGGLSFSGGNIPSQTTTSTEIQTTTSENQTSTSEKQTTTSTEVQTTTLQTTSSESQITSKEQTITSEIQTSTSVVLSIISMIQTSTSAVQSTVSTVLTSAEQSSIVSSEEQTTSTSIEPLTSTQISSTSDSLINSLTELSSTTEVSNLSTQSSDTIKSTIITTENATTTSISVKNTTQTSESEKTSTTTVCVATPTQDISSPPQTKDSWRGIILLPLAIVGVFWGTMIKKNFA